MSRRDGSSFVRLRQEFAPAGFQPFNVDEDQFMDESAQEVDTTFDFSFWAYYMALLAIQQNN